MQAVELPDNETDMVTWENACRLYNSTRSSTARARSAPWARCGRRPPDVDTTPREYGDARALARARSGTRPSSCRGRPTAIGRDDIDDGSRRPMERFQDRRIIVTGGASGIGRATVLRLLAEAGTVHTVDVAADGLERHPELADAEGVGQASHHRHARRVRRSRGQTRCADVVAQLGGLDVLVNAAGILRAAHTHESTLEMWNQVIGVNLTGTYLMTRAALPVMLDQGTGVIVNFSSTSASFGHPYMAAYAASKGGIDAFTHTIAIEYGKRGIRAVAVAPGSIESGITESTPGMLPPDADWTLFDKMSPVVAQGFAPRRCGGVDDRGARVRRRPLRQRHLVAHRRRRPRLPTPPSMCRSRCPYDTGVTLARVGRPDPGRSDGLEPAGGELRRVRPLHVGRPAQPLEDPDQPGRAVESGAARRRGARGAGTRGARCATPRPS